MLSRLIEVWSGQSFDRLLQQRILAPLQMNDTGFDVPASQRHRIAQMTSTDAEGRLIPSPAFRPGEGFGLGGYVGTDPARRGRLGSVGDFGWSGAASTYFTIDRQEGLIALLMMQHLPQGLPRDPPRLSGQFYNLVYQSQVRWPP